MQPQGHDSLQSNSQVLVDDTQRNGASRQPTILFRKDGSNFGVTSYWLDGGSPIPSPGMAAKYDLDSQSTVDETGERGVTFTLRLAPP